MLAFQKVRIEPCCLVDPNVRQLFGNPPRTLPVRLDQAYADLLFEQLPCDRDPYLPPAKHDDILDRSFAGGEQLSPGACRLR